MSAYTYVRFRTIRVVFVDACKNNKNYYLCTKTNFLKTMGKLYSVSPVKTRCQQVNVVEC